MRTLSAQFGVWLLAAAELVALSQRVTEQRPAPPAPRGRAASVFEQRPRVTTLLFHQDFPRNVSGVCGSHEIMAVWEE